ncbi:immunoglobulin superfamily member 8 isoform X1 [Gopherus evgoodei]|uniref:immunoglobulin superfamily member 8 isoform X1 n=1 Tax=Gopherus evgoodei TaxID=1825980 RepID=UPI0011CF6223|nr:immunoglobulin superfamily member 8 isoform X1 [Gopherus evgoodei]
MGAMREPLPRGALGSLLLLLLLGLCGAREVHLPPGPLFRVEGTAISIPCSVSEYEGPTLQHFEWLLYRPTAPKISIGMVSTRDPSFPYAVFSPRVQSGEVSVQRLRGDAVELRIARLRAEDAGVYECYTPTTDSTYHGNYSSKVVLKVIPDMLWVLAPTPRPPLRSRMASTSPLQLSLLEGQELQLSCMTQSQTQQHTHLSVSFGVSAPDAPVGHQTLQEVVGVRRDFAVEAGEHFADRYQAGELSMAKAGSEQYKLAIGRVRPGDAGTYHCTVGEWIQDPDSSWQLITEKRAALAQVTVQSIASQLAVSAGPPKVRLSAGDALELLCNLSGPVLPAPHVAYAVSWVVGEGDGLLVAQLDTDGVAVVGESYANSQVGRRQVSLQKLTPAPGSYRLRIESAQPGDEGTYRCVAQAYVHSPDARLREVASSQSQGLKVHMKSEAVVVEAYAWLPIPATYRGDTAELLCNISVESTQAVNVAVSWWVEVTVGEEEPQGRMVASVSRDGVAELGRRASGGDMSLDKVGPQCHRLRLHGVQPSDEGRYHCAVTSWVRYPDRSWYNAGAVKSNSVAVYPYARAMDTLFIPLIVGIASALFTGIAILATITCCFMRRLRKR